MAASLRARESQIGGFASLLVRAGNINASDGVNTGFKTDTTGKLLSGILTGGGLLSKVPILGGLLGAIGGVVKSLFGTKTSVIGSGLYGDEQSLERSEEHTSELQSLMRISYAVFCLKKNKR